MCAQTCCVIQAVVCIIRRRRGAAWICGFSELGVGEWDVEGFHLIVGERSDAGMVLEIESCGPVAGCPGCGVIAQGHGRVVVEVIDAP